jgi:hypothetical protein
MRKAIQNYLLQSALISFILAFIYYLLVRFGFPQLQTNSVYLEIALLFLVNGGFHIFLVYASESKTNTFIQRFLASTMIKLFIYIVFILAFVFSGIHLIKVFLVSFLICYVVFFIHEISSILQYLKKIDHNRFKSK